MSNRQQNHSTLLQQVTAYLCDYDLDDEVDVLLQGLAQRTGCNGLFLLRVTSKRRGVKVKAMYRSDDSVFSQRDAELLLRRVSNNNNLQSYASLKHPVIIEDISMAIDDLDSQQQLVQAGVRSVLLLPACGEKHYIFGAYRYDCDGLWDKDLVEALTLAGNVLGYSQEVYRLEQVVNSNELVCIEHLYRMPMSCVHISADNRVVRFNARATQELGVETLQDIHSLIHPLELPLFRDTMALVREQVLEQASCDVLMRHDSATKAKVTFLSLSGENGLLLMFVEAAQNEKLTEPSTNISFNFDGLTGLANRAYFESLYSYIAPCTGPRKTFIGFMNLDSFQIVNNVSGHQAGDQLLREVAERLKQLVRRNDVVARLSGDEFGILMPTVDQAIAEQVAQRICHALNKHEFVWGGRKHSVSISMGLAECDCHADSISDLLRRASAACRVVKEGGGNGWYLYASDDPEVERLNADMNTSVDVIGALANDRFELYFQPIETLLEDGGGLHLEILLRMQLENGEYLLPGIFLPAAERFNLVSKIDRWVVEHLLRWGSENIAIWRQLSLVSINLSALSIGDRDFINWLEMRLLSEPELVNKICFEITETAAVSQLDLATELINMVKSMGCTLALDDFGSGFSSFAYLKLLDIDYVKIDGQFIQNLCSDKADQAIVSAICQLGRDMDFKIVAEYVESIEIGQHLAQLGVEYGQGFGIARPMPLNSLLSGQNLEWYKLLSENA
ncbi:putative bifunctional diguanylate cyclase/phosphodiesterase [Shewanella psychrotolerans]|uniref:putative bifunctional diguanylate cyclase/phosphodiesterase n=1 Tax=Shewanella psychrotolerans TaxID=2864206 RepID=UPI001C65C1F2|nr:EAL domain-containing protein [Shewanella psychrotolerans]QYK00856.1 EAL domain-containing protein [Shewanella psychrotolerans]